MIKRDNKKVLKTISLVGLATTMFASASNAFFWDSNNDRALRVNPQGQEVPAIKQSFLERTFTFHEELKPTYNPKTQRVETRYVEDHQFNGVAINTESPTVKPEWYDRWTTYREEQKRPWNPYENQVDVEIPAYMYMDSKEARMYSKHYTQDDLQAVPYMYGSASLVLRKEQVIPTAEEFTNLDGIKDPYASERANDSRLVAMQDSYIRPAGGFDTIDYRSTQNQLAMASSDSIMISEPINMNDDVSRLNNVMIGNPKNGDVKIKTKITDPKMQWRDKLSTNNGSSSRPGDFDYAEKQYDRQEYKVSETQNSNGYSQTNTQENGYGQEIASTGSNEYNPYSNNPYQEGKVNSYSVESGDTLSEISDKEKIYGDWTLWPLIYDANRAQVQDPDLIEPGQNLDIPRDYDQYREEDARDRSRNREQPISLYDGR